MNHLDLFFYSRSIRRYFGITKQGKVQSIKCRRVSYKKNRPKERFLFIGIPIVCNACYRHTSGAVPNRNIFPYNFVRIIKTAYFLTIVPIVYGDGIQNQILCVHVFIFSRNRQFGYCCFGPFKNERLLSNNFVV